MKKLERHPGEEKDDDDDDENERSASFVWKGNVLRTLACDRHFALFMSFWVGGGEWGWWGWGGGDLVKDEVTVFLVYACQVTTR